jgi:hypothetical protein
MGVCEYVSMWVCEYVGMWVCEYVSVGGREDRLTLSHTHIRGTNMEHRTMNTECGTKEGTFVCVYHGRSMYPLLREGDLLTLVHLAPDNVRRGDVVLIAFDDNRDIIHRVVDISAAGIRTRGDNRGQDDPWLLNPQQIRGVVTGLRRGPLERRVARGRQGLRTARLYYMRHAVLRTLLPLLHPAYHALAGAGWLRVIVPRHWRPRVTAFRSAEGLVYRLITGKRVVGWYNPDTRSWDIERPYRLLADPAALSIPEEEKDSEDVTDG